MSGDRLPVILCCAEETEVALVAVIDALHREGFSTEVVPGVETEASLLTAATDRVVGAAVFVLCQSDDLDRFQVRRLQGLFSARKGPEHQMITVDVHAMGPMAILPEVRVAARSAGTSEPEDEDDGRFMRDVVLPAGVSVPGASIPERPRRREVVQEPEGISEEALGLPPSTEDPEPPRKVFPEPDVLISTDPTGQTVSPFDGRRWSPEMGDGVPREVPDDVAMPGETGPNEGIRGAPDRVGWEPSGPVEVERVSQRAAAVDPRAEADSSPLPGHSTPIEVGMPEEAEDVEPPPPPPRRSGRLGLLLLAGAGMAGVVAMAVMHGSAPVGVGPDGAANERGVPTARGVPGGSKRADGGAAVPQGDAGADGEAAAGGSTSSAAQSTGSEPAGESGADTGADESDASTAGGSTGGADDAQGTTGGEATTGAGDGATEGGAAPASDDAGTTAPKTVPPPPTAIPSQVQLDAAIEAAIADGRLEALDQMLISRAGAGTMTWDDAAARCRRRKVDGLRGWKLPSKGQLIKMRKAKLLLGGSYWSRSVVGGDEVYALDVSSGRMNVWLKMEPNARALCVRKRPSS